MVRKQEAVSMVKYKDWRPDSFLVFPGWVWGSAFWPELLLGVHLVPLRSIHIHHNAGAMRQTHYYFTELNPPRYLLHVLLWMDGRRVDGWLDGSWMDGLVFQVVFFIISIHLTEHLLSLYGNAPNASASKEEPCVPLCRLIWGLPTNSEPGNPQRSECVCALLLCEYYLVFLHLFMQCMHVMKYWSTRCVPSFLLWGQTEGSSTQPTTSHLLHLQPSDAGSGFKPPGRFLAVQHREPTYPQQLCPPLPTYPPSFSYSHMCMCEIAAHKTEACNDPPRLH